MSGVSGLCSTADLPSLECDTCATHPRSHWGRAARQDLKRVFSLFVSHVTPERFIATQTCKVRNSWARVTRPIGLHDLARVATSNSDSRKREHSALLVLPADITFNALESSRIPPRFRTRRLLINILRLKYPEPSAAIAARNQTYGRQHARRAYLVAVPRGGTAGWRGAGGQARRCVQEVAFLPAEPGGQRWLLVLRAR